MNEFSAISLDLFGLLNQIQWRIQSPSDCWGGGNTFSENSLQICHYYHNHAPYYMCVMQKTICKIERMYKKPTEHVINQTRMLVKDIGTISIAGSSMNPLLDITWYCGGIPDLRAASQKGRLLVNTNLRLKWPGSVSTSSTTTSPWLALLPVNCTVLLPLWSPRER